MQVFAITQCTHSSASPRRQRAYLERTQAAEAFAAVELDHFDVSINLENFLRAGQRPQHIVDLPADPRESERREVCYSRQGLRLGPSWEAGFWYRQLTEEWSLPAATAQALPA